MFDYTISCLIVAAMSIFWMWIRVQRATQESKLQKGYARISPLFGVILTLPAALLFPLRRSSRRAYADILT